MTFELVELGSITSRCNIIPSSLRLFDAPWHAGIGWFIHPSGAAELLLPVEYGARICGCRSSSRGVLFLRPEGLGLHHPFQTDSGFLSNILHCSSRPAARHIQNMFITRSARTRRPRCLCGISTAFCFRASPCSAASTRPSWRCGATPRDSCRRPRSTSGCCPKAKAPDLSPKTCRNCRHPQKILERYALMVNTWSILLSFEDC